MRQVKIFTIFISCFILSSCITNPNKIRIAYPNWAEGIAVTYLVREILAEQGFHVELLNADIAPIFTSLAQKNRCVS
jgi:glycine betaine/proline transport system substrate-binding protein